jgi:hypothetical protein
VVLGSRFWAFFAYCSFLCSDSTMITLGADVEHALWRPSLARFIPTQGRGQGLVCTSRLLVMEAIPL